MLSAEGSNKFSLQKLLVNLWQENFLCSPKKNKGLAAFWPLVYVLARTPSYFPACPACVVVSYKMHLQPATSYLMMHNQQQIECQHFCRDLRKSTPN